jgi:N-acyl-D-amino-acid deacylase
MPHQRWSESGAGGGVVPIKESIEIAEKAGIHTVCSHVRINDTVLGLLNEARDRGVDIAFDSIPYPGSIAANIVYELPHWLSRHRDMGFDYIISQLKRPEVRKKFIEKDYAEWIAARRSIPGTIEYKPEPGRWSTPNWELLQLQKVWTRANKKYVGKTFKEIAEMRGVDPWTAWFDIVCEEGGYARWLRLNNLKYHQSEEVYSEAFEACLKVPYNSIESDGPISSPRGVTISSVDPRSYGTFPLVLAEYVRKRKVLSWESAIQQMTLNPAKAIGITDRGVLRKEYWADICIFNPETVTHRANFKNSLELSQGINHNIYPEGIDYTIVNGRIVNEKGLLTGYRAGKVLRKS